MAQDYASRQRKRIKPKPGQETVEHTLPKTRGAVPLPEAKEAAVAVSFWERLPGWGWLATGLVAGFLVANLGQSSAPTPLQEKPPLVIVEESSRPEPVQVAPAVKEPVNTNTSQAAVKSAEKAVDQAAPRFDFYTLLPESEVVAPEVEAYKSTPREAENQPRYMLQVGSFRSHADAKKQQARLKALGYDNLIISEVNTAASGTWYRVQVGPYQDRRLLARTQNHLAKSGLDFMLLRLKDEAAP